MERWLRGRKRPPRKRLSREIGIVGSNPTLSTMCSRVPMLKRHLLVLLTVWLLGGATVRARIFDNRYFFLYTLPRMRHACYPSYMRFQPFIMAARHAFGDKDDTIQISALQGPYDQAIIARALVAAGITETNILPSDLQTLSSIPWLLKNKVQAEGIGFGCSWRFNNAVELGIASVFMHARSHFEYKLSSDNLDLKSSDISELYSVNQRMHELLSLEPAQWAESGIGDIDAYIRWGRVWEYTARFKKIDTGVTLGFLFPTGHRRDIDNPASLPFGGNGHYGIYGALEGQFELREDWLAGFTLTLSKRLKRTFVERLPILGELSESSNFGAILGSAATDPGITVVFAPYFALEHLREGLGIRIIYTIARHTEDTIQTDAVPQEALQFVRARSAWGADHVTVNVLYDFGSPENPQKIWPVISLAWDIPVNFIVSERVSKTHTISLVLEVDF